MRDFVCDCGHKLIYHSPHDGMLRYSTKVIKSLPSGDGVIGVCRQCGAEKALPISIDLRKSFVVKAEIGEEETPKPTAPKRIFRIMDGSEE